MSPIWREGNRFTLLPEASRFLPAMLEAIHHAQHYVLIELYLMESGRLADRVSEALVDAVKRGHGVFAAGRVWLDGIVEPGPASLAQSRCPTALF